MSDELKPSAEHFIPIALYDALARERERLAREVVALRARVAELEAFKASVPWDALCFAYRTLDWYVAKFALDDDAIRTLSILSDWLVAHAPKEAE